MKRLLVWAVASGSSAAIAVLCFTHGAGEGSAAALLALVISEVQAWRCKVDGR